MQNKWTNFLLVNFIWKQHKKALFSFISALLNLVTFRNSHWFKTTLIFALLDSATQFMAQVSLCHLHSFQKLGTFKCFLFAPLLVLRIQIEVLHKIQIKNNKDVQSKWNYNISNQISSGCPINTFHWDELLLCDFSWSQK